MGALSIYTKSAEQFERPLFAPAGFRTNRYAKYSTHRWKENGLFENAVEINVVEDLFAYQAVFRKLVVLKPQGNLSLRFIR